jgi:hypothetical protein
MANGAATANLFDDGKTAETGKNETLLAHAERIDAMARELILEVGKFRGRLEEAAKFGQHHRAANRMTTDEDRAAAKTHPIKSVMTYFDTKHQKKFDGEAATFTTPQDPTLLKKLIATHGEDKVRELVDLFFEEEDDWLTRTGYTIANFHKRVAGLISSSRMPVRVIGNTPRTAANGRHSANAEDMIRTAYGNGANGR